MLEDLLVSAFNSDKEGGMPTECSLSPNIDTYPEPFNSMKHCQSCLLKSLWKFSDLMALSLNGSVEQS
jgi:hypothetical protein